MMVRIYTEADRPLVSKWFDGHDSAMLDEEFLPTRGFIVDERIVGWVYLSDSRLAMCGWVVSDPDSPVKKTLEAAKVLVSEMSNYAHDLGYYVMYASTSVRGLGRLYESLGFIPGDTGRTDYIAPTEKV